MLFHHVSSVSNDLETTWKRPGNPTEKSLGASSKLLRLRDAQHGGGIGVAVVVHRVAAALAGAVPERCQRDVEPCLHSLTLKRYRWDHLCLML